ncbi:MAG: HDIG domain-containing metalloprotein [Fidelibacterota bacterium]
MSNNILELWPEIGWIEDEELREKVTRCWEYALEKSALSADDLRNIPFSLLIKDCKISFMNHKRTTVHLAVEMAKIMKQNFGDEIEIDMDILIAGAILMDVGKLFEYKIVEGKLTTSGEGKLLRHPFSGVAVAHRFGLPAEVQHIIATHSKEGDFGKRSVESVIAHHADFVTFDAIRN